MDTFEQARRYIAAIPGAISGSGGHAATFHVACVLVHGFALSQGDAWALLQDYNRTCSPPWSEKDLRHKLDSAMDATSHEHPRGHLISKRSSVKYRFGAGDAGSVATVSRDSITASREKPPAPSKSKTYDLSRGSELPSPLKDGTRALLKAAFRQGEGICLCPARENDEGKEVPRDAGTVLSREEWLAKLDSKNGDPNKIFFSRKEMSEGLNGIYACINPIKLTGTRANSNVTDYRHALIEFDNISTLEQWRLIEHSNIPCTAVISSGGKSLHAWVRVDAKDHQEYAERVRLLYSHFDQQQRPDEKNKDPARLSRLANCMRGNRRQELLALGCGAESFSEWIGALETDGIGQELSVDALLSFVPAEDSSCIIGKRYLCKGGSMMFVGQSGIGKSSLAVQAATHWAVGRSLYGIAPVRPLKSVFVQAENDEGDLAEMLQGVVAALGLTDEERERLRQNLVFITDATHIGDAFVDAARRLIDKHRPDLFWGDPLLSFIGDDVSKQAVCARFLRSGFGPIQKATGVVVVWVHHVGKPPADPKANKRKTITDYSYAGTGSSELTNWPRAVCVLQRVNDDTFELKLAKRGKRAGAKAPDGTGALSIWLKQAEVGIHWQQVDEPVKESRYSSNKSKDGKPEFDVDGFMAGIGASVLKYGPMIDRVAEFAGVSERRAKAIWAEKLKDNFTKDEEGFYKAI